MNCLSLYSGPNIFSIEMVPKAGPLGSGTALLPLSQLEAAHQQPWSTAPGAGKPELAPHLCTQLPLDPCSMSSGAMLLIPSELASSTHMTAHVSWKALPVRVCLAV